MAARHRTEPSHSPPSSSVPVVASDHPLYSQILSLQSHVLAYQRPGLLDRALETVDLSLIYSEADLASEEDDELGYQDHVIKALLRWFKESFFTWVNSPPCSLCSAETKGIGATRPNSDEATRGAGRTELYRCTQDESHIERFPRFNDPETLLTWRKGRCGEFANCFTMLCIALGSRARWIWNAEDHVWTEVYSEKLKRWVHCDACENAWDSPQIYAVGWGKKMSYCIGFSFTGAQDVTRRYVRKKEHCLSREAPEQVVSEAIRAVNQNARLTLPAAERAQYSAEDAVEDLELQRYIVQPTQTHVDEEQPRASGSASWVKERGEDGSGQI